MGGLIGGEKPSGKEVAKSLGTTVGGLVAGKVGGKIAGALADLLTGGGEEGEGEAGGGGGTGVGTVNVGNAPDNATALLKQISMYLQSLVNDGFVLRGDARHASRSTI